MSSSLRSSDVPKSSLSSQVRVTSPSSQSHLKFFQVESESSHKNCRVIGLQARVTIGSEDISHFSYVFFCYEMARNML